MSKIGHIDLTGLSFPTPEQIAKHGNGRQLCICLQLGPVYEQLAVFNTKMLLNDANVRKTFMAHLEAEMIRVISAGLAEANRRNTP